VREPGVEKPQRPGPRRGPIEGVFRGFTNWQAVYGAFPKSHAERAAVIAYIMNQEEHHHTETFIEEFKQLLKEEGISFDERSLR